MTIPTPTMPQFQLLSSSASPWWPIIQIYEAIGAILMQNTTIRIFYHTTGVETMVIDDLCIAD